MAQEQQDVTDRSTVRVTLRLAPDVVKAIRVQAAMDGTTPARMIEALVREWLLTPQGGTKAWLR